MKVTVRTGPKDHSHLFRVLHTDIENGRDEGVAKGTYCSTRSVRVEHARRWRELALHRLELCLQIYASLHQVLDSLLIHGDSHLAMGSQRFSPL